jgi:hypothetical protein
MRSPSCRMARQGAEPFAGSDLLRFMPRYFFHRADGECLRDGDGSELPSMHEARCEAVKVLAEYMRQDPCEFWETQSMSVTVADERGLTLFTVDVMSTAAPAAGGSRQAAKA